VPENKITTLIVVESPTKVPILSKFYYCYILKSSLSGKYYIGCTHDCKIRLNQHNAGKVRSTKRDKPWELIYSEKYATLKEARKRERQIKDWKSRNSIERLLNKI
jgi:putative endonuclease